MSNQNILFKDTHTVNYRTGLKKPSPSVDNLIQVIEKYNLLAKLENDLSTEFGRLNPHQSLWWFKRHLKEYCKMERLPVSAVEAYPIAIMKMRGVDLVNGVSHE
jgi:hypothetical protein